MPAKMSAARKLPPASAIQTQIVTRAELEELAALETSYKELKGPHDDAEKRLKAARLALAQKVLGVESAEQWSALDPETLDELQNLRHEQKLWKPERHAPPFVFLKTWSARLPSWRDEFIKVQSEAEAERITAETPKRYAYRIDVAV